MDMIIKALVRVDLRVKLVQAQTQNGVSGEDLVAITVHLEHFVKKCCGNMVIWWNFWEMRFRELLQNKPFKVFAVRWKQ